MGKTILILTSLMTNRMEYHGYTFTTRTVAIEMQEFDSRMTCIDAGQRWEKRAFQDERREYDCKEK